MRRYGVILGTGFMLGALMALAKTQVTFYNSTTPPPGVKSVLLPDLRYTPGVAAPGVTAKDICAPGYATRHRPPDDVRWRAMVRGVYVHYGVAYDPKHYEADHDISIELGGSPSDPRNLWPETRQVAWGAEWKDQTENALHHAVCADGLPLPLAQKWIAGDWRPAYRHFVLHLK